MYRQLSVITRFFSRRTMDAAKPKTVAPPKKKFGNTETLRHVKHKQKLKGKLPVSGVISLQICGTGGYDCPRSLVLSTDHNKYLFNCGEGTQRLINEHKLKAARLEHIFITHQSWENVGGLLGMALTLQAVNVPLVMIHGPPGVEKGVQMSKSFADMKAASIQKIELEDDQFSDHTFTMEPVILRPDRAEITEAPERKKLKLDLEKDLAVAYICRPHPYPRKVDLAKCVDLGIKSGPILGQLKAGEVVTLADGREIKPDQILGVQLPSGPIIIVELPRSEYLKSLLGSEPIKKLQSRIEESSTNQGAEGCSSINQEAEVVVHMSNEEIIDDERYQKWMKGFSSSTRHLILNPNSAGPTCKSPYRCQSMLNLIHHRIFPLLNIQNGQSDPNWVQNLDQNAVKVTSNLLYNYRPRRQFDTSGIVILDNDEYINESHAQPEFTEKLKEVQAELDKVPGAYDECKYPHLVFLGTGSSVPSNTRNVSGILFHLDADSCLLLDCGEGSLGQLWRFYGSETRTVLKNLKGILISHLHADHHLGVFSVLLERHRLYHDEDWYGPLDIVGPANYKRWANSFLSEFVCVDDCMRLGENHTFLTENLTESQEEVAGRLSLKSLTSVSVNHCKGSFGFVMVLLDGRKVTYSGDTMPCEDLILKGADSDLLIHEATMENDLVEEARRKTHSTTSEAIDVGRRMNAKFTLLTHFSQRYAKIPVFGDEFTDNVGIAFDNMRVDLEQLRLLPLFIPALKALFADHYAELEANIEKRQIRARALEIAAKASEEKKEKSENGKSENVVKS